MTEPDDTVPSHLLHVPTAISVNSMSKSGGGSPSHISATGPGISCQSGNASRIDVQDGGSHGRDTNDADNDVCATSHVGSHGGDVRHSDIDGASDSGRPRDNGSDAGHGDHGSDAGHGDNGSDTGHGDNGSDTGHGNNGGNTEQADSRLHGGNDTADHVNDVDDVASHSHCNEANHSHDDDNELRNTQHRQEHAASPPSGQTMEASGTCVFSAQGTAARYTAEAVIPQGEGRLDELINADRDKSSQSARSPESGESPPSGMQTPSSDGSSADISILSLPKASMPCESRRMSEVGQSSMVSSADVSLEVAFSRVQELGRENLELKDTIRGNNTAIRLAHDQLMLMRSAWERDRDEVRAKNEEARVVVMELKTECDQKDLRIKALEKELDQVKSLERDGEADSTASMQEEVRHLLVDLEREKLERQHLSNENAALRSDAEDLRGRCSKANQEVLQTHQRRTELESRVNDLQDQLTKLTSIKSSLAQEKNELVAINNSLQSQLHVYKMASPTGSLDHSSVDGMDEDEAAAGFVQVNLLKSAPGGDFSAAGSGRTASGSDVIATETEEEERADTLRAAEGASTPRTSRENIKVKHEGAVSDLLIQLRVEREEKMQVENARRQSDLLVEQLRSDLRQNEAELVEAQSKLSGLIRSHKEREDDLTRQMALLQKNIRSQDQQYAEEELQNTRAQVLSLVNELQEANTKATAAKKEADSLHEKNQQLEERLNRIHKEKDDQRNRDDQLISTLGASVRDLEGVVASDRQKLEEYRTKMDRVVSQARQLTSKNEEYRKQLEETKIAQTNRGVGPAQMRDLQETVDSYMAKLMGAEDTARGKDDEIQQLKLKIQQIKSDVETVPVLQAQADLYKMDFEAEHHARVRSETEKSKLLEEMDLLRATIQQLQEQIGNLTSHPLAELQRRHVDASLGGPGTRQPNHQVVHQDMTYATYPRNRRDYYGEHDEADLHEMSQPCCCPRCNEVFPDLDSLHVHLAECVR